MITLGDQVWNRQRKILMLLEEQADAFAAPCGASRPEAQQAHLDRASRRVMEPLTDIVRDRKDLCELELRRCIMTVLLHPTPERTLLCSECYGCRITGDGDSLKRQGVLAILSVRVKVGKLR
jgi:hypothetical protein